MRSRLPIPLFLVALVGPVLARPGPERVPDVGARSRGAEGEPPRWEVEARIFGSDQTSMWGFGNAVALDGETALVGAWGADVGGATDRGAAYVFVREGDEWVEQAQLLASDGAEGDRFGWSVALDGDTAIVAAPFATVEGQTFQGAVYVFERSVDGWTEVQKLLASDGAAQDRLGWSVAIEEDTILAGAIHAWINGNNFQGAVYAFATQEGVWIEVDKLFDPEGQVADLFGSAAALQGDTALIGAHSASIDGDPGRGASYVFQRIGTAWLLEQKLLASDGTNPDQFGGSVALDHTTALIGADQKTIDGNVRQGAAYVFRRNGTTWVEEQRLTASNGHAESSFGLSAALDGHLALVGAELDFPNNPERGVVYEFRYEDGAWVEVQWFAAPIGHGLDDFGESIALTHERLLVGNHDNTSVQPPGGTAWIFRRPVLFEDGFESGDTGSWDQTVP